MKPTGRLITKIEVYQSNFVDLTLVQYNAIVFERTKYLIQYKGIEMHPNKYMLHLIFSAN